MAKRQIILMPFLVGLIMIVFFSFKDPDLKCNLVKNGRFHFYQNNNQYHSVIIRKDSLQTEVNLITGDSTTWKIVWISDCQFTCSFIWSSKKKSQDELDFYKKSIITFNIRNITEKYYTYDAFFSSGNLSKNFFSDTIWLQPK